MADIDLPESAKEVFSDVQRSLEKKTFVHHTNLSDFWDNPTSAHFSKSKPKCTGGSWFHDRVLAFRRNGCDRRIHFLYESGQLRIRRVDLLGEGFDCRVVSDLLTQNREFIV